MISRMPTLNRRKDNNQPKRQGKNNRAFYQSHRWHEYSRQYRKKHRLCVKCLEQGKTVLSQCVDHILRIEDGGDMWDSSNHQSLCLSCHSIKTKKERKGLIQIATVNVVYGPPCSGKSSYINSRKAFNDITIDVDDFFEDRYKERTSSELSTAFNERDRRIELFLSRKVVIWIPTTTLKGRLSEIQYNLITIHRTQDECISYLLHSQRPNKEYNQTIINQWFINQETR